jgi:hypothetical protein
MHYCPRHLADGDARDRSATHITARLGAQAPGARTTRFCRTQITPVVCATPSLTVARPAKALRADVARVHHRPARVRDDRDTPLFLGPECAQYPPFPNFCKGEYFHEDALTDGLGVLPVGQREIL